MSHPGFKPDPNVPAAAPWECSGGFRQLFHVRSGYSLIELLIVISGSAVLMSLVGVWTFKLLQFSVDVRQRHSDSVSMNRLAIDFRRDVRWADQVKIGNDSQLDLHGGDGNLISYRLLNHPLGCSIEVQQQKGDQVLRRDEYRLSEKCLVSWDLSELPDWTSLVIYRRPGFNIPSHWDGKISPVSSPQLSEPSDSSAAPVSDVDPAVTAVELIGPIELQIRVAPHRWGDWKIVHEF